jgi:hypothetical protein
VELGSNVKIVVDVVDDAFSTSPIGPSVWSKNVVLGASRPAPLVVDVPPVGPVDDEGALVVGAVTMIAPAAGFSAVVDGAGAVVVDGASTVVVDGASTVEVEVGEGAVEPGVVGIWTGASELVGGGSSALCASPRAPMSATQTIERRAARQRRRRRAAAGVLGMVPVFPAAGTPARHAHTRNWAEAPRRRNVANLSRVYARADGIDVHAATLLCLDRHLRAVIGRVACTPMARQCRQGPRPGTRVR